MNLIERKHSKWGMVKLEMREHTYEGGHTYIHFYYPSGEFMGEWDEERGGGLGHPDEKTEKVIQEFARNCRSCGHDHGLYELDEHSYIELEDILTEEVNRVFPGFLK